MTDTPKIQMPQYECHKKVWALKIAEITPDPLAMFETPTCRGSFVLGTACGHCARCQWEKDHPEGQGATITPADEGFLPFTVDRIFMNKHKPQVGGYFVVYEDGYKSFSPAKAFEDGYTRI